MNFRSPPPHKRSSGHKGGRSEFEQTQAAIKRTVERLGYHKLPINDESLRPFLEVLWRNAREHGLGVMVGDQTEKFPGRLYCLVVTEDSFLMKRLTDAIRDDLLSKFSREEIARAVPVIRIGEKNLCYFEGVWTPVDALDGRKH